MDSIGWTIIPRSWNLGWHFAISSRSSSWRWRVSMFGSQRIRWRYSCVAHLCSPSRTRTRANATANSPAWNQHWAAKFQRSSRRCYSAQMSQRHRRLRDANLVERRTFLLTTAHQRSQRCSDDYKCSSWRQWTVHVYVDLVVAWSTNQWDRRRLDHSQF